MHETTVTQPFQTMRDSQFPRDGKHTRGALQLAQLPSLPGSKGERPQHSRANSLSWEDRAKGLGRPRWPALAGQSAGEETVTQRCGDLQGVSPWSFQHDWLMSVRDPPAPPPPGLEKEPSKSKSSHAHRACSHQPHWETWWVVGHWEEHSEGYFLSCGE